MVHNCICPELNRHISNNVIIFIDAITVYVESNIILLDCVSLTH